MNVKLHVIPIVIGIALAVASTFGVSTVLFPVTPFTRFSDERFVQGGTSVDAINIIVPRRVASSLRSSQGARFQLTCPGNVKINESFSVSLEHDRWFYTFDNEGNKTDYTETYPVGKGAQLSSSGFEVAPDKPITKESKSLPASFVWTATPKSEGEHLLVIDISELIYHQEGDPSDPDYTITNMISVNDAEETGVDLDSITIPVTVYTIWGISSTTYQFIKWGVGALVFVVTYPLLLTFVKRKLGWGDSDYLLFAPQR